MITRIFHAVASAIVMAVIAFVPACGSKVPPAPPGSPPPPAPLLFIKPPPMPTIGVVVPLGGAVTFSSEHLLDLHAVRLTASNGQDSVVYSLVDELEPWTDLILEHAGDLGHEKDADSVGKLSDIETVTLLPHLLLQDTFGNDTAWMGEVSWVMELPDLPEAGVLAFRSFGITVDPTVAADLYKPHSFEISGYAGSVTVSVDSGIQTVSVQDVVGVPTGPLPPFGLSGQTVQVSEAPELLTAPGPRHVRVQVDVQPGSLIFLQEGQTSFPFEFSFELEVPQLWLAELCIRPSDAEPESGSSGDGPLTVLERDGLYEVQLLALAPDGGLIDPPLPFSDRAFRFEADGEMVSVMVPSEGEVEQEFEETPVLPATGNTAVFMAQFPGFGPMAWLAGFEPDNAGSLPGVALCIRAGTLDGQGAFVPDLHTLPLPLSLLSDKHGTSANNLVHWDGEYDVGLGLADGELRAHVADPFVQLELRTLGVESFQDGWLFVHHWGQDGVLTDTSQVHIEFSGEDLLATGRLPVSFLKGPEGAFAVSYEFWLALEGVNDSAETIRTRRIPVTTVATVTPVP